MLKSEPKESERVLPATLNAISSNFYLQLKVIARKLGNPRLLGIRARYTLRHWKGTTGNHKTKDPYHVKRVLGHRRMDSTMLYINVEQAIFQNASTEEFHVKVAQAAEEIKVLIEVGFEYVLQKEGLAYFRKRK